MTLYQGLKSSDIVYDFWEKITRMTFMSSECVEMKAARFQQFQALLWQSLRKQNMAFQKGSDESQSKKSKPERFQHCHSHQKKEIKKFHFLRSSIPL